MTDPVPNPTPDELPVTERPTSDTTAPEPSTATGAAATGSAATGSAATGSATTGEVNNRPRRISVPLIILGLLIAGGISYCSVTGFSTTSGVSPCFTALPVARNAIHVKATFVGVQRLGIKDLQEDFPILSERMPALGTKPACVVAYRGTFQPADVIDPRPADRGGKIALVIVPDRAKVAAATLLRDRVPAHFRQLFGRGPHR